MFLNGGILERFNRDRGRISESTVRCSPESRGQGTPPGALKATVGGSSQGGPLSQQVSVGQRRCGGHMVIVGGEPCGRGKALEMCRVRTLLEVLGGLKGRAGWGDGVGRWVESRPVGDAHGRPSPGRHSPRGGGEGGQSIVFETQNPT